MQQAADGLASWQQQALQQMWSPWGRRARDRRFSGEPGSRPLFEALARSVPSHAELVQKALAAAPIDQRSKGHGRS